MYKWSSCVNYETVSFICCFLYRGATWILVMPYAPFNQYINVEHASSRAAEPLVPGWLFRFCKGRPTSMKSLEVATS